MINAAKILIVTSITIFVIGLAPYIFGTTAGKVVTVDGYEYKVASYTATKGGAYLYPGREDKWQRVTYKYEVNGKEYKNNFIGFWVPLNLGIEVNPGESIAVHYLPQNPNVSVLVKGSDWRVVGSLLVLAFSLLGFNHFIHNPEKYA